MKRAVIFQILLIAILSSCEETSPLPISGTIGYGTSFGECLKYCQKETTIGGTSVVVVVTSWDFETAELSAQGEITEEVRSNIIRGIDQSVFKNLASRIGCPDCADGGAEWLEVNLGDSVKRVTFEYGADINGIAPAIKLLRELTENLDPTPQ